MNNTTVDNLILENRGMAEQIARRFPSRGVDRDDLRAEADLALVELAHRFVAESIEDDFSRWAAFRVRDHLRKLVRDKIFAFLADVPESLKRRAIQVHRASENLKRRGVWRPTYEEIAAEAQIDLESVVRLSAFESVIGRQTTTEWIDVPEWQRRKISDEPDVWPAFGPQPFGKDTTTCESIHPPKISGKTGLCCMVCYRSGRDHARGARRPPADKCPPLGEKGPKEKLGIYVVEDPISGSSAAPPRVSPPVKTMTRRERRRQNEKNQRQNVFPPPA